MKKKIQKVTAPKKVHFGLKPIGDRVIIMEEKEKEHKKTDSGIYIPDTVKDDKVSKRGTVVAVGEGKYEDGKQVPLSVKPGDKVLFGWGDLISYKGEEYYIVRESEIIAVVS